MPDIDNGRSLYILGRGPSHAIANEAALKFKETCNLHAEAYSAAEVLAWAGFAGWWTDFRCLRWPPEMPQRASIVETGEKLARDGAAVHIVTSALNAVEGQPSLPFVDTGHPLTDALALIVPFYGFVEALARSLGLNPDRPEKLKKVTETTMTDQSAILAPSIFDGSKWHSDSAAVLDWQRHGSRHIVPGRLAASDSLNALSVWKAGMLGAGLCRSAGQWRRRRLCSMTIRALRPSRPSARPTAGSARRRCCRR